MENQNLESCMHLFYETKEDMEQSLKTIVKVKDQQDELANIVARAKNKKHDFSEFVKDTKDGVKGYANQMEALEEKLSYIKAVIEVYEKGHKQDATEDERKTADLTEQVVTTVCLAMGIVPTNAELKVREEQAKAEAEERRKQQEFASRNVKA